MIIDRFKMIYSLSTTQRSSVHAHRGLKEPEHIHILEAEIRKFEDLFSLQKISLNYESIIKTVADELKS